LHCAWPFADGREPPKGVEPYVRFRQLGHAFHGAVADYINEGVLDVVAVIKKLEMTGDLHENVGAVMRLHPWNHASEIIKAHPLARAEVTYAYDPQTRTARVLGENLERKYIEAGLLPHEIPGTADAVWTEADEDLARRNDLVAVHDWKLVFGKGAHVPPPETNAQLHTLALCAMLASGAKRARVQLRIIDEHGESFLRFAEISMFQATMTTQRVLKAVAGANAAEPTPGKHCVDHYCPMLASCPAIQSSIVEAYKISPQGTAAKMPIVIDPKKIANDAHAAYLVTVSAQVEAVAKMVREACKQYVRNKGEPIEMTSETVWGPHKQSRSVIVAETVEQLVTVIAPFVGGHAIAQGIVMAGVTRKALEREVANHSPKGALQGNMAACMHELATFEMIKTVSDGERFEERKKK
jgi:hypothetical protein